MLRTICNKIISKIASISPGGGTIRPFLHRLRGVRIGTNAWIAQYVYIDELHPEGVTIGDNCTIGLRTSIFAHFYWGGRQENYDIGRVVIENDVFVGPHCVILPNVRIGRGAVIRAGTVVTRDVPPETLFGPPPAVALGRATVPLTSDHTYEQFLKGLRPARTSSRK